MSEAPCSRARGIVHRSRDLDSDGNCATLEPGYSPQSWYQFALGSDGGPSIQWAHTTKVGRTMRERALRRLGVQVEGSGLLFVDMGCL